MQPARTEHHDITPGSAADVSDNAPRRNTRRQLIQPLGNFRCRDRVLPGVLGSDRV